MAYFANGTGNTRCAALDDYGIQCKGVARKRYSFHGDSESRTYDPGDCGWVVVPLCCNHAANGHPYSERANRRWLAARNKALKKALHKKEK